jgi:protein gp37
MASYSSIEWTEATWNPVTGCSKISPGCTHCYAERMAARLKAMGNPRYHNGFRVTLHHDFIDLPARWRKSRLVFVNSMSDLFHEQVPVDFIKGVFETMRNTPQHRYQVLTKRAERLVELAPSLEWPPNVWMGVTVENQDYTCRVDLLRRVPAYVRFLSIEPLIGPITDLPLHDLHWVIVGGESGPGARPMDPEWVRRLRAICLGAEVPFFFKQWGGTNKKAAGRLLDGREWNEMPDLTRTTPSASALHG